MPRAFATAVSLHSEHFDRCARKLELQTFTIAAFVRDINFYIELGNIFKIKAAIFYKGKSRVFTSLKITCNLIVIPFF